MDAGFGAEESSRDVGEEAVEDGPEECIAFNAPFGAISILLASIGGNRFGADIVGLRYPIHNDCLDEAVVPEMGVY
ncbi:hypothetical protein EC957_011649 [Mortierella hygrophila]|uniref:Uncharacterized protein n=1 Tax=Mortierella hygrophila TaxID=979708 RepID=A0A9P6K3N9_9FUNG|nr:hypothetical protein EC957_011649 [Mortierella hygrophila]